MPTPPNTTDLARRLQEISTLLQMIHDMHGEPNRTVAIADLWLTIEDLCVVPDDHQNHHHSHLVRVVLLLIKRLLVVDEDGAWDSEIEVLLEVIALLSKVPLGKLVLQMPTITDTKGKPVMPTYDLALDKIATFTITEQNTGGTFDPVDPTDVFTVINADATNLNAVIGANAAGAPALVVNWLHSVNPMLTGVSVVLSDSLGNTASEPLLLNMVAPAHKPDVVGVDVTNVVTADQPVPV